MTSFISHIDFYVLKIGAKIIPEAERIMTEKGSKQVPLTGINGKKEATYVLTASAAGGLLPTQAIYAGKTIKCHPAYVVSQIVAHYPYFLSLVY